MIKVQELASRQSAYKETKRKKPLILGLPIQKGPEIVVKSTSTGKQFLFHKHQIFLFDI
jgi:hypothetical protein